MLCSSSRVAGSYDLGIGRLRDMLGATERGQKVYYLDFDMLVFRWSSPGKYLDNTLFGARGRDVYRT